MGLNYLFALGVDKISGMCVYKNNKPKHIKHYQIYCAIHFGFSISKDSKGPVFTEDIEPSEYIYPVSSMSFSRQQTQNKGSFSLDYHNSSAS